MTTTYTRTADDIIKKALLICRAYDPNQDVDASDYSTCLDTLNALVKSWQAQGYNLWMLEEAVLCLDLFDSDEDPFYVLGGSATTADNCCNSDEFHVTTSSVAATTGDETLTVTDETWFTDMGAPDIYSVEQTSDRNAWVRSSQTVSCTGDTLTQTNTAGSAGYITLSITDLTVGNSYRITYGYDSTGTGSGLKVSLYSDSSTLVAETTKTITGTYTMDFTADQTTATFKALQNSSTINHTEIMTAWNMVDKNTGNYVGVELDDGTRQWLRLVSVSGSVLSLSDALDDDVTDGNTVYTYSNKIAKPMRIMDVRIQDSISANEVPADSIPRKTYMNYPDKRSTGGVVNVYYQPRIDDGRLYVWPAPDSVVPFIKFGYVKSFDVMESTADSAQFPAEWFLPLSYALAEMIAPEYKTDANRLTYIAQQSQSLLANVLTFDNEGESLFLGVDYD